MKNTPKQLSHKSMRVNVVKSSQAECCLELRSPGQQAHSDKPYMLIVSSYNYLLHAAFGVDGIWPLQVFQKKVLEEIK